MGAQAAQKGWHLPPSRLMGNLRLCLDSRLLPEEQLSAVARKAFAQLHLAHTLHTLPRLSGGGGA